MTACEEALGMGSEEFLRAYEANRADGCNLALESSQLYQPLGELARQGFTGTVAELLARA